MKSANPSAEQVKAAREKAVLTQEEAGAVIGYTRRAWQNWEAGNSGMRRVLFELFVERTKGERRSR